jgi:hypothetical protein
MISRRESFFALLADQAACEICSVFRRAAPTLPLVVVGPKDVEAKAKCSDSEQTTTWLSHLIPESFWPESIQ